MARGPFWEPDPASPRRGPSDWRGILGLGAGGLLAAVMVGILIAMIVFLVLVFTADGDGDPKDAPNFIGAPAGEGNFGDAVRSGDR